jgi:hypothetical protein
MQKKPELTVVPSTLNLRPAPANLAATGRTLWERIQLEFRFDDSPGIETLTQICLAADRAAECAESIKQDGLMIRTKNGFRDNPLLKTELTCRSFVVRSLHRLGFDIQAPRSGSGRPPGC